MAQAPEGVGLETLEAVSVPVPVGEGEGGVEGVSPNEGVIPNERGTEKVTEELPVPTTKKEVTETDGEGVGRLVGVFLSLPLPLGLLLELPLQLPLGLTDTVAVGVGMFSTMFAFVATTAGSCVFQMTAPVALLINSTSMPPALAQQQSCRGVITICATGAEPPCTPTKSHGSVSPLAE